MNKTEFSKMYNMIADAQKIAITMHVRPDGDSIGTAAALCFAYPDKEIHVYVDGEVPQSLEYIKLPITQLDDENEYDLLIVIDACEEHRLGENSVLIKKSKKVIVFDHHLNPTMKCDILVSDPERASCAEIMFEYFNHNKIKITKQMAEALYTGVSSDTGCFLFPNTTAFTHYVASELFKIGIDAAGINYLNFRVYDPKKLSGLLRILDNIKFLSEGRIAVTVLDYKLVQRYSFKHDERHRFSRYATDASGVVVSLFLTEAEPGEYNVSLRGNGSVNVAEIASRFGGGGHHNAAGLRINGKQRHVVKELVQEVEKSLDTHKQTPLS